MHIYPKPVEKRPIDALAQGVVEEVGDWVDTTCIAELIFQTIREQYGILPTVQQCREVWLRVLDHLGNDVGSVVRWMRDELDPVED